MLSHHERTNMAISRSGLPKTVLELFDPRADLEYKAPLEPKKPALPLLGLAGYTGHFPGPDDPDYQPSRAEVAQAEERKFRSKEYHLQVAIEVPSIDERRAATAEARKQRHALELEASVAAYDPKADPKPGSSDPMKTIFVSRLDYATGEPELRAEFARHGTIRSLALVRDKEGKSRGYAFIEYEHTGDMKAAYKAYPPDGFMKVGKSERWSLVDVERGRTVPDWRPMRLGGGKGGESRAPKPKKTKGGPPAAAPLAGPPGMGPPGGPMARYGGPPPRDDRRAAAYPPRPDDRRSGGPPEGPRGGYGGDRRDSRGPGGYDARAPDRGGRYGGPPDDRANGASRYGGGGGPPGPPGPSRDRYGGDGVRERSYDRRRGEEDGGAGRERDRDRSRDRDRDRRSAGYGSSDRRGGDDGGGYGAKRDRGHDGYDRRAPDGGHGRPRGDDRDAKRGRYDDRGGGGGRYDDRGGGRDYRRG